MPHYQERKGKPADPFKGVFNLFEESVRIVQKKAQNETVIVTRPGKDQLEIVREYAKTERDTPGTINGIDPGAKSEFKV